ncbi:MAG: cation diffusion facilitator family transporter [Sphaerochaetaceae bacterium]
MKPEKGTKEYTIGLKVSLVSIVFSIILALLKLISGVFGHSSALISDGLNSLSDIFSYSVVAGGVAASDKRADTVHQYGHEKLESIISLFLALAIIGTGFTIGYKAVVHLINSDEVPIPTLFPLIVAVLSIITKLYLWRFTAKNAIKTNLSSLKALATDHLSDMLSSIGALIGVIGAKMGYPLSDPLASLIIAALIIKAAIEVFLAAFNVLMDASVDKETIKILKGSILKDRRILALDLLRTRSVGSGYWVEVEIKLPKELSLYEAHRIAEQLHDRLEKEFPRIKHVMVHTNPSK